jgi:hypothetical protein
MEILTTPTFARTLRRGDSYIDPLDVTETVQVVQTNQQNWHRTKYVGDTINGIWYGPNESVRFVVGGSTK